MNSLSSYIFEQQSAAERYGRHHLRHPSPMKFTTKGVQDTQITFLFDIFTIESAPFSHRNQCSPIEINRALMFLVSQYSSRCRLHNVLYTQFGNGGGKNQFQPNGPAHRLFPFFFFVLLQPEFGECLLFCDLNKK